MLDKHSLRQVKIEDTETNRIASKSWPILKKYDQEHIGKIAFPLGGIGTGTVSLGGRGDLRDWEIVNRCAKGFTPTRRRFGPFFAIYTETADGQKITRALEGPVEYCSYEGEKGCPVPGHGLPRFRNCSFATAYPLAQVMLSDHDVPVDVCIQAFNPLIPADTNSSGIPVAILRYVLTNTTDQEMRSSVCGSMPNFIGIDGSGHEKDWNNEPVEGKANRNEFRKDDHIQGIFMYSNGVAKQSPQCGTMALTTISKGSTTYLLMIIC